MTITTSPPDATRVPKPPLTSRQRRGAAIAGIVGFLLATLGWFPFVLVGLGYLVAFGVYFVGSLVGGEDSQQTANSDTGKLVSDLIGIPAASLGVVIAVACLVGVLLIAIGIVLSIVILKRHAVDRAAGVTWLGLLLAIVGSWIFDGILVAIAYGVANAGDIGKGQVVPNGGQTILYFSIAAVIHALLGWLCWWWMARALRKRVATSDHTLSPETLPAT